MSIANDEYLINFKKVKITKKTVDKVIISFGHFILWYLVLVLLIIPTYNYVHKTFWGEEVIGSPYEKEEYSTGYWFYLQPDDAEAKNYRVKGIVKHSSKYNDMNYVLEGIVWPNGNYDTFTDCDITLAALSKEDTIAGEVDCITDKDQTNYTIRVGEKVNPNEAETRKSMDEIINNK